MDNPLIRESIEEQIAWEQMEFRRKRLPPGPSRVWDGTKYVDRWRPIPAYLAEAEMTDAMIRTCEYLLEKHAVIMEHFR